MILALDQGTSSSRAIVFDFRGNIVSSAQKEVKTSFPEPGWIEQNAQDIWQSQFACAKEAVGKRDIAAIGIANQRETTLIWDRRTGTLIYPAIVWQDRRTAHLCHSLKKHEALIRKKTGLLLDPYFSATKIQWILDHVSGARQKAKAGELAFGTVDTWLLWQLTEGKVHATDSTNASRTMLFNIYTRAWDDELLSLFNIPPSLLPAVHSSAHDYGVTRLFHKPISILGMAGDQQAALYGQGCLAPGNTKVTYGTGCFILMNTGEKAILSEKHLLTTIGIDTGDKFHYALEGSIFIAGAAIQWLRDNLQIIEQSSDIDPLAASVPDTGGVFFVPAFTGLGAPHWDPHARGALLGLTRGTTRAHIARAALEGIAFQAADIIQVMAEDAKLPIVDLRVDGGVCVSDLMLQLQADLIQAPLSRPKLRELTAFGAAALAARGTFHSLPIDKTFEPKAHRTREQAQWNRAVDKAKGWIE